MRRLRVCAWVCPLQTPSGAKAVSSAKRAERESGLDWAEEILVTKVDIEESNNARSELQVRGAKEERCDVSVPSEGMWALWCGGGWKVSMNRTLACTSLFLDVRARKHRPRCPS